MQRFDMVIIGSGSGLEVSSDAAALGLSASLIGDGEGICPRPLYWESSRGWLLVSIFLTGTAR